MTDPWIIRAAIIQAAATAILVGITGWYAYLTRRILLETKEARLAEFAPYVQVFFDTPEDIWIDLVVKNVGRTPARDVVIRIDHGSETINKIPIVNNNFPFLPPDYEVRYFVAMLDSYLASGEQLTFWAEVAYRGENEESWQYTQQVLDLSIHKYRSSVDRKGVHHIAENLGEIEKKLETLSEAIKQQAK